MSQLIQIETIFENLGTPRKGQLLVREARVKAPVREVQSRGSNVITSFVSRKMGCEIKVESRHIEFPAAVNHEYDKAVLEFYPQPCRLTMELIDEGTGEVHKIEHFPDFLVLRENSITLEEWKSDAKLAKLAERYPYRYRRDPDGMWCAPLIERYLADYGLEYRLYTDLSIPRVRIENTLHLADYYHPGAPECDPEELIRLHAVLDQEKMLFIADLTNEPYSFSADFIFKAIADGLVVANLDHEPLTDQRRSKLYRDATYREFISGFQMQQDALGQNDFILPLAKGTRFRYEHQELEIELTSEKEIICRTSFGETTTLSRAWITQAFDEKKVTVLEAPRQSSPDLARYSEEDLTSALKRQALLDADPTNSPFCERTMRDWRTRASAALANGDNEILALVPRTADRGNRSPRFSDQQESLLNHLIEKHWKTAEAINYSAFYSHVCIGFDDEGLAPPSYPTVIARIKAQATTQDVRMRHGKRKAYQTDEFVNVLYAHTPAHGSRPLQYVHIDHTLLDIELISHRTGKKLGRPWLSLAIDAYTRRVVGFYLSFDPPSYVSVSMVMRDIVRRFQRLPEFFIVDNGRDLTSEAFQSYLRVMGVHLRLRPAGQPRAGAVMERLFGTAHSQYIHNLAGNTKATKEVRMVTGKHLPANLAQWTLESLYHGFSYWATQHYDTELHPSLGCSPREMFQRGLQQSGHRAHRQIVFNQDFLIATCPPSPRDGGLRRVNNQRGVKVHDLHYWNPAFRDPQVAGQKLPVRYDPWDASTVYVRVKDRWEPAKCRSLVDLGQLTNAERQGLTAEYQQQGGKPQGTLVTPQRLREFIQVWTPKGALATELDRQHENKSLYNALGMSHITPISPPSDHRRLDEKPTALVDDANTAFAPADDPNTEQQTPCTKPTKSQATQGFSPFDTF